MDFFDLHHQPAGDGGRRAFAICRALQAFGATGPRQRVPPGRRSPSGVTGGVRLQVAELALPGRS